MFPANTKFLIVDDYATMRKIVKKILLELGFAKLEEAEDGKIALEKLKAATTLNDPFQCVISDWNMPNMTGLDFLRAVRSLPEYKNLPFILATAEGEQSNIIEAAKAGVSEYVVKPFTATILSEKLQKTYQKHTASTSS